MLVITTMHITLIKFTGVKLIDLGDFVCEIQLFWPISAMISGNYVCQDIDPLSNLYCNEHWPRFWTFPTEFLIFLKVVKTLKCSTKWNLMNLYKSALIPRPFYFQLKYSCIMDKIGIVHIFQLMA